MQPHYKPLATALAAALQLAAIAAVPLAWDARPGNPAPASFDRYHGEALEFRCTFRGFGELPFAPGADIRLWYQTNGMGSAWWSAPATVQSNVITATWSPALDPGADRVSLFFGAPSNVYASAVLRLRHSPGFTPSELTLPVQRLDFAAVELCNISALTNGWSFGTEDAVRRSGDTMSGSLTIGTRDRGVFLDPSGNASFAYGEGAIFLPNPYFFTLADMEDGHVAYRTIYYPDGDGQLALTSDIPADPDLSDYARLYAVEAAATSATNYTDQALASFSATGQVDYAESAGSTSYAAEAGAAMSLYDSGRENSYTASDFATKTELGTVTNDLADLRTESALVYRLYSGSNVVAEVTNYNSAVHAPSLRLMQLNESNEYVTVWAEADGLARTLNSATNYADRAIADYAAPRAWSRTTSGLGSDAPANTTWISTPRTVIAGGLEYAKIVDTYGEVWVLTSNGMTADFTPDTNAYFRITADDGTPVFSIEKSDAQVVGAYAEGITAAANSVTMPVPVVSAEAPTMYWRQQLDSGDWSDQATPPTGATVTWTGSAGSWVCTVTFSGTRPPSMFFKFSFIQEGGVVIRNNATTDLSSGIWVNGTKFVPTVSGNNLIWTKQ